MAPSPDLCRVTLLHTHWTQNLPQQKLSTPLLHQWKPLWQINQIQIGSQSLVLDGTKVINHQSTSTHQLAPCFVKACTEVLFAGYIQQSVLRTLRVGGNNFTLSTTLSITVKHKLCQSPSLLFATQQDQHGLILGVKLISSNVSLLLEPLKDNHWVNHHVLWLQAGVGQRKGQSSSIMEKYTFTFPYKLS